MRASEGDAAHDYGITFSLPNQANKVMIKKTQMLDQGPGPGIAAGHMVPTRPVGQVRAQADRVGHREPIPIWNRFKNYDSIGIVSLLESFGGFGFKSDHGFQI